jgi:hypothetical protein
VQVAVYIFGCILKKKAGQPGGVVVSGGEGRRQQGGRVTRAAAAMNTAAWPCGPWQWHCTPLAAAAHGRTPL